MQAAILLAQIVAGFGLIVFGAWVTWKGIRIITQYYPLTLKTGEALPEAFGENNQPKHLVSSMIALVNAEIAALANPGNSSAFVDLANSDGTPGGVGDTADAGDAAEGDAAVDTEVEEPETVDTEETTATGEAETVTSASKKSGNTGDILDGVASVITALPKLLNANFGPATVVCVVGMLIIASGFYLLLKLNAG